jgi:catechol 2,3-dioxygenase
MQEANIVKLSRREFAGAAGAALIAGGARASATETDMDNLPFAATTPVSISRVGLRARDADKVADYYKAVLGLTETGRSGNTIRLSAGGRELLEIEGSAALNPDDPRSAGLYHTAFLLPSRLDLARWVQHAIDTRIPVDGASDHHVSEAIYLHDPEGNGVEIYADRDRKNWSYNNGSLKMGTEALNFPSLMQEVKPGDTGWKGARDGTVVGHVHLRVGNTNDAEQFWNGDMDFDTVVKYGPQAVFLSTGGYHHHIGANSWQSAGAGPRKADTSGLSFVELAAKGPAASREDIDPWGNVIRTVGA